MCAGCGGCTSMSYSMGVQDASPTAGRPLFCPEPQTTGTGTRTPRPALGEMGGPVHTHPGHGAKPIMVVELLRELLLALVMTSVSKRPYGSPRLTKTKHGSTRALRHQRAGQLSLRRAAGLPGARLG